MNTFTRIAIAGTAASAAALTLLAAPAAAHPAPAEDGYHQDKGKLGLNHRTDLYVLTEKHVLTRRGGLLPSVVKDRVKLTGVAYGEQLVGLDLRPATGQLYSIADSGQLYVIDPESGVATAVGSPVELDGDAVGFDFNPTVDLIRVVTDEGQNLRLRPADGTLAGTDTPLSYAAGDPAEGEDPEVTAAAYTDSVAGATSTALYGLDSERDTLVLQGTVPGSDPAVSPNTGLLTTVGSLGVDISEVNGFDIVGVQDGDAFDADDYQAVAAVRREGSGSSFLTRIDLETGDTGLLLPIGSHVVGLTAAQR